MPLPSLEQWKNFWTLFFVQLVSYCLFCLSLIVVTRGDYLGTVITDTLYGLNSYFIIRRISTHQESKMGLAGFTIGGTVGSLLAIWLAKKVHGR